MFKKFFSLVLVVLLCCSTPMNVFAQTEHSHVEGNDVSNGNEGSAITNTMSLSSEMIEEESETVINSDYVMTTNVDSEYLEWLLGVPDEIISASTIEVLEYFLESPFMGQQIFSCSSTFEEREIDFSCHEAFRELVSREDCIEVLESFAGSILYSPENDELNLSKFEKLLSQPLVESLLSDLTSSADGYPNLQSMYTQSEVVTSSVGNYVGSLNGIKYYSAGTIETANGRSVDVLTAGSELTQSQITNFNSAYDYDGNIRMSGPTSIYNCHSYAWYRHSSTNPYWIDSISQFKLDSACTRVSSAQTYDIIVYVDANGDPLHSGVVYSVDSSGDLTVCSKWGQAGVYLHAVNNVPLDYCSNQATGQITCYLYRYHDYANQHTGNEYHSGARHYFEYADICKICGKQTNTTWTSIVCDGPPCAVIMKLEDEDDIS